MFAPHTPQCIPFCGNGLHRLTHQWILVQNTVEMIHAQREEITVRLRPDAGHSPGIRQQTNLAEIRAIRQGRGHLKFRVVITFRIAARTHTRPGQGGLVIEFLSLSGFGSKCENFPKLHVSEKIDTNLIASFRPPRPCTMTRRNEKRKTRGDFIGTLLLLKWL